MRSSGLAGKGVPRKSRKPRLSASKRAMLDFPVARIHRILKKGNHSNRVSKGAAVYMAGVLQYLTAEVMEVSGFAARDRKKRRITPRLMTLALGEDVELAEVFSGHVAEGGVVPMDLARVFPRKKSKKSKKVQKVEKAKKVPRVQLASVAERERAERERAERERASATP